MVRGEPCVCVRLLHSAHACARGPRHCRGFPVAVARRGTRLGSKALEPRSFSSIFLSCVSPVATFVCHAERREPAKVKKKSSFFFLSEKRPERRAAQRHSVDCAGRLRSLCKCRLAVWPLEYVLQRAVGGLRRRILGLHVFATAPSLHSSNALRFSGRGWC